LLTVEAAFVTDLHPGKPIGRVMAVVYLLNGIGGRHFVLAFHVLNP